MLVEQTDYIIAGFLLRGGVGNVNLFNTLAVVFSIPHGLAVKPKDVVILLCIETAAGHLEYQANMVRAVITLYLSMK